MILRSLRDGHLVPLICSRSEDGNIMNQWSPPPRQWHSIAAETPNSVLLETSRFDAGNRRSYLFLNPVQILSASEFDEIPGLFRQLEGALAAGLYVAGFVGYESGYHFQSLE